MRHGFPYLLQVLAASCLSTIALSCVCPSDGLAQTEAARPAEPPAQPPAPAAKPVKSSESSQDKSSVRRTQRNAAKETPSAKTQSSATADKARAAQAAEETPRSKKDETKKDETKEDKSDQPESKKIVRLLELSGHYVDLMQPMEFDAAALLAGGESLKKKSFYRLCEYLSELGKESQVGYVVFDLSDSGLLMNPAQLDELTRRLEKLKSAGKHTIAWLENPSNVQMSLAAACDEVVLADFGGVDMPSVSMQSMFFRDAMDLIGVQASVVRAGDFKGAVEPFLNPQMSEHLREHYVEMLSAINDAQVDRIARGRGLTVAQLRELQKQRLLLPEQALAKGLVDRLAPYGAMQETVEEIVGQSVEWTKPKVAPKREMSMFELMGRLMSGEKKAAGATKDGTIAVLHLSGGIEDGKKESPGAIVSGPAVKAIGDIAKDSKIKGVVVRINSPGGSATASEAIRRALAELAEKKPTVVSMGEMAASGGYWIACIGQPIYAEKGTITGSIGVFSLKISLGSLLRRVGVHVEALALDDAAKSDAIDRPWSEHDMKSMQEFVDDVYDKFLRLVSKSRGIQREELDKLAGGRVWSGTQAKRNKLIDEIGGLDDCLAAVAKKAKLDKYEVIHRPVVKSGLDLLELLGEEDPSEIELRSLVPIAARQAILARGFNFQSIGMLVRSALGPKSGVPQVWALCPHEILLR